MKLTEELILQGLSKSLSNSESFFQEAELLLNNNFISRSYTLFHFCVEETGRFSILLKSLFDGFSGQEINTGSLKKLGFFNHKEKLFYSDFMEEVSLFIVENVENREMIYDYEIEEIKRLEEKIKPKQDATSDLDSKKNDSLFILISRMDNLFLPKINLRRRMF